MYKIFIVSTVIALASGRPQHDEHGHALSSQSIVLHAGHQQQGDHGHQQLQYQNQHEDHHIDYYAHPKYSFEYKVQDPHTGDNKYQHETRDGDVVQRVYSLHEADGTVRIVEYSSDKHTGFNAIVRREGHAQHVQLEYHQPHH